ncbi:MAG: hypothetical protein NTW87_20410 [Planctomycetota bacterium]|nr:hypothetical protein [Planctomycetota bacterium]
MNENRPPDDLQEPELVRAGAEVARLPKLEPPPDLVARTLARLTAGYKPVKRLFWLLRPIYNPVARVAAAAIIIVTMLPMADLNMATPLGARIEQRIIGRRAADRIEVFIDKLLLRNGPPKYSQYELQEWLGVPKPEFTPVRRGITPPSKLNRV